MENGIAWVYYKGDVYYVILEFNDITQLVDMYPDAIYFFAGVEPVPLEE